MRRPGLVDWQLQDAGKPWGCSCFAVLAAHAELTRVQPRITEPGAVQGGHPHQTEGDFSSESALRALLRRNGKDFPVFSQAKCVPSCSEQTSGFGGCAAKSSAELGSSWAARVA